MIEDIKRVYPATVKLATVAILFEIIVGISAGVLAGLKRGGFVDNLVLVSTLFVISIPVFVIGFTLQYLFGVKWGIVPPTVAPEAPWSQLDPARLRARRAVAGLRRPADPHQPDREPPRRLRPDRGRQGPAAARSSACHLLRNSLIPVVTFIGIDFGALMGGAIVTEGIFNIPGVGGLTYRAITPARGRDGRRRRHRARARLPGRQPARRPALRRARPEDPL